jgi:hypothetical protein
MVSKVACHNFMLLGIPRDWPVESKTNLRGKASVPLAEEAPKDGVQQFCYTPLETSNEEERSMSPFSGGQGAEECDE